MFQSNLMAIHTQFTRWLIRMTSLFINTYDLRKIVCILRGGKNVGIRLIPNPAPKPTPHRNHTKSYKLGCTN